MLTSSFWDNSTAESWKKSLLTREEGGGVLGELSSSKENWKNDELFQKCSLD